MDTRAFTAVGVALNSVTRWVRTTSHNAAGSRAVSRGTTTSRAPRVRAPHISHTEKSKALEWVNVHTSADPSGPSSRASHAAVNIATTLRWLTITPLGWPVEPEV